MYIYLQLRLHFHLKYRRVGNAGISTNSTLELFYLTDVSKTSVSSYTPASMQPIILSCIRLYERLLRSNLGKIHVYQFLINYSSTI